VREQDRYVNRANPKGGSETRAIGVAKRRKSCTTSAEKLAEKRGMYRRKTHDLGLSGNWEKSMLRRSRVRAVVARQLNKSRADAGRRVRRRSTEVGNRD